MRKYFLLLALPVAVFFVSGCNPFSYFMIYEYSSSEKPDTVADERMTELEQAREQRMALNPNYREAEIEAYRRSRSRRRVPISRNRAPRRSRFPRRASLHS